MSDAPIFSRRLLMAWIAGAIVVFAISMFFLGAGEVANPESIGASTFSRSAIGHAGIAEVLQQLGIPTVKSRYNSLDRLGPGGVLVLAEPRRTQSDAEIGKLLTAPTTLLVLPKWTGQPSEQTEGWLREAKERPLDDA
jgi:hypothetical protein